MHYIIFLKAVNVSGKNILPMEKFRTILQSMHCTEIKTYIQSGNAVCSNTVLPQAELAERIEKELLRICKVTTTAFLYTLPAYTEMMQNNPFLPAHSTEYLHLTMLKEAPATNLIDILQMGEAPDEKYVINANSIYLYCPDSYGNTKLSNSNFERKLKVTATTRKWATIVKMMELVQS